MKFIKTYENIVEPQINDYVICKEQNESEDIEIHKFVSNNIGQLKYIEQSIINDKKQYFIKYNNIPEDIKHEFNFDKYPIDCRFMYRNEIIHFSPNIEDLMPFINAIKYNL